MPRNSRKTDRTARLLKLQLLLWQQKQGMDVAEIARRCSISKRTVYRDLVSLETELKVPIWEDGNKRGIVEGYFLPPVTFTQAETINIFLAARLMQNFSYIYNPDLVSTFIKLNTILPPHLRDQVKNTLDYLEKFPRDERKARNFIKLAEAWLSRHRVTFKYRELESQQPVMFDIEPYFIEPSNLGMSSYVIAYCSDIKNIRGFKVDHILGEVTISQDTFEIPASFNVNNYLDSPWDIFTGDRLKTSGNIRTVKLRFSARIAWAVLETLWHPSQQTRMLEDGSMIMTLKVRNTLSFRTWIMRWEKWVEVLEPEDLRKQIAGIIHSLEITYNRDKSKRQTTPRKNLPSTVKSPSGNTDLTDDQWKDIRVLIPTPSWTGRPRMSDRQIINGIVYVLKNKIRWNDLPRKYGAPTTCYSRYQLWKKTGVWARIQPLLFSSI